ncbi:MAG: M15 family metallopeptidase [Cellvibrio sp.]
MNKKQNEKINVRALCGIENHKLTDIPQLHCRLHRAVVKPLLALRDAAHAAGFDLRVASSYRSFDRQLHIWNAKVRGERPVLDDRGLPFDISDLSERELVFAILRWSALPGASRHHWGTDLDVYDSSLISEDYVVQLTVAETLGDGPFAPFHQWLDKKLEEDDTGFYRPYAQDRGGVAPEPWHLSYAPIAAQYVQQLTEAVLREQIEASEILLKQAILDHLPEIYQRFVCAD